MDFSRSELLRSLRKYVIPEEALPNRLDQSMQTVSQQEGFGILVWNLLIDGVLSDSAFKIFKCALLRDMENILSSSGVSSETPGKVKAAIERASRIYLEICAEDAPKVNDPPTVDRNSQAMNNCLFAMVTNDLKQMLPKALDRDVQQLPTTFVKATVYPLALKLVQKGSKWQAQRAGLLFWEYFLRQSTLTTTEENRNFVTAILDWLREQARVLAPPTENDLPPDAEMAAASQGLAPVVYSTIATMVDSEYNDPSNPLLFHELLVHLDSNLKMMHTNHPLLEDALFATCMVLKRVPSAALNHPDFQQKQFNWAWISSFLARKFKDPNKAYFIYSFCWRLLERLTFIPGSNLQLIIKEDLEKILRCLVNQLDLVPWLEAPVRSKLNYIFEKGGLGKNYLKNSRVSDILANLPCSQCKLCLGTKMEDHVVGSCPYTDKEGLWITDFF